MIKADKKIRIWTLSDGKPGHANQTEGLTQALAQYRHIKLVNRPILSRFNVLLMLILNKCGKLVQSPPDLIIATGHRTHLSLLAYKHCYGGRIVTMMSPSLPLSWFDLCLIPRHDKPKERDNVIETIGAINRILPSHQQIPNSALIMLGGPSKHFNWDENDVLTQMDTLMVNHDDVQWTMASSRRTPKDFINKVRKRFPAVDFVLAEETSAEWLPKQMQESEQIWVTEDSVSMVYEALTAGAKTGIIRLPVTKHTRVTKEIDQMVLGGYLSTVFTDKPGKDEKIPQKKFEVLNEADRCSKLLLNKFEL